MSLKSEDIENISIVVNTALTEINAIRRTKRHRLGDAWSLAATSLRLLNFLPPVPSEQHLKQSLEGFKRRHLNDLQYSNCNSSQVSTFADYIVSCPFLQLLTRV